MTAQESDAFASDPNELPRDRFKRPLVFPPNGGKRKAYTRCTTFVGGLEDTYKLSQWQQRHVALGLAMQPQLVKAVDAARDDRDELDRLCEDAKEAAGANDASRRGTAMHTLTEQADRGEVIEAGEWPDDYLPDLAAYLDATSVLEAVSIEQFSVLDAQGIGGTPDRVVRYQGQRYIADLKTGSIDFGTLKIAAQLAVYARSHTYDVPASNALGDVATHEQATALRGLHGASLEKGIVIHLPAGEATCTLYWVDLLLGWRAVLVGRDVREQRKLKFRDLISTFDIEPSVVQGHVEDVSLPGRQGTSDLAGFTQPHWSLAEQIVGCADRDTLTALWRANVAVWTPELSDLAKTHLASLAATS